MNDNNMFNKIALNIIKENVVGNIAEFDTFKLAVKKNGHYLIEDKEDFSNIMVERFIRNNVNNGIFPNYSAPMVNLAIKFYDKLIEKNIKFEVVTAPAFLIDKRDDNNEGLCVSVRLDNNYGEHFLAFIENAVNTFLDDIDIIFKNRNDIENKTLYIHSIQYDEIVNSLDRIKFRYFYECMKNN